MTRKVIRSLDQFSAQFVIYGKMTRGAQRLATAKSTAMIDGVLDMAARRAGGGDNVLSGVGKTGARLSHKTMASRFAAEGTTRVVFTKQGPWQIRDNSAGSGPTRAHSIRPNHRKSPRPMFPASKYMPSMKSKAGVFYTNYNTGDPSGDIEYIISGTARAPYWRNAIQLVQPKVIDVHKVAFDDAAYDVFA